METLLSKMRGSEYNENENDKVMGRLEWLNHLSLIFNLTASVPSMQPCSASITTEAFLNTLIENFQRLPLFNYADLKKISSVKCLSFKEVFVLFENDFGKVINWDYIMEKVIGFQPLVPGHRRGERSESPGSIDLKELVFISKLSSSSVDYDYEIEHKAQRIGDLRIPQTPPGLEGSSFRAHTANFTPSPRGSQDYGFGLNKASLRVPECGDNKAIYVADNDEPVRLNLSCKKIAILSMKLPNSLIELNLSHNRLTRMPNFEDVEKLEYLNLSWNLISSVVGVRKLRNLKELYMAHNRIVELEALSDGLVILDVSFNKIANFQGISALCAVKSLRIIDIEGNSIMKQTGFHENFSTLLPWVTELDSKNLLKYSKFQSHSISNSKYKHKVISSIKKSQSLKIKNKKP